MMRRPGFRGRSRTAARNMGIVGGVSDFADTGGALSGAAARLDGYSDGFAVDFRDLTMVIKDTVTPANNFNGNPNAKLAYPAAPTVWVRDASGVWGSGTSIRTHHEADGTAVGFPFEETRTNLFLNSRAPVTQGVSVTAQAYTLSFVGTGTITLSGASAAGPLVGAGANDRVSLTFTPAAGTLTMTVSGTMDFVQLEAGAFATSPIVTVGVAATRTASFARLAASAFPFNGDTGTIVVRFRRIPGQTTANLGFAGFGGYASPGGINVFAGGAYISAMITPTSYPDVNMGASPSVAYESVAVAYNLSGGSTALFVDDVQFNSDTNVYGPIAPGASSLSLGVRDGNGSVYHNAFMESFVYIPERLTGAQIAALGRPAPTGYDVFVVAGQSNTLAGAGYDPLIDTASIDIDQWLQGGYVSAAKDPLDHLSRPAGSIGFAMSFAKAYIAAGKLAPGRKVLLIPCGSPSTGFVNGFWTPTGALYSAMVNRANAVMAGVPDPVMKGILWHQGESDVGAGSASYAANLDTLISGFRAAVTGATNSAFVCGGLADAFVATTGANGTTVQNALSGVGGRVSKAAFASAAGLATSDGTHFTAASQRTLGAAYFTAYDTVD